MSEQNIFTLNKESGKFEKVGVFSDDELRDEPNAEALYDTDCDNENPKETETQTDASESFETPDDKPLTAEEIALAKRNKFISLIAEKQAERQREIAREADAKDEARSAKKRAESLDSEIVELFLRGPDSLQLDDSPLLTLAEREKETGACEGGIETTFEQDAWRGFKVTDSFEVSDAFFDKLNLDYDATVGELSDLLNDLMGGRKKIKGVGSAFLEKISAMFDAFWESDAYRQSLRLVVASDDGAKNDGENEEASFEEILQIVEEIIPAIDQHLSDPDNRWEGFDGSTYLDIRRQVVDEKIAPTRKQYVALCNILDGFEAANEIAF